MTAPQNFRSSFNGFNREDVVHYLEYINNKHNNQVSQLTAENQELRAAAQQAPAEDQSGLVASLQDQCAELTAQLEEEKNRCAALTEKLEALELRCKELEAKPQTAAPVETMSALASEELEAYRRAERIEREARERSELVYFQANGVLTEAAAKVDTIATDITDMADQVMSQLTQLQIAVSSSKQALQDASSIMGTIRPNK
jgi:predicted RNase H-like nuclease (RuvC/YqgF family)